MGANPIGFAPISGMWRKVFVNSRVKIHKWGDFVKNWPFFVRNILLT